MGWNGAERVAGRVSIWRRKTTWAGLVGIVGGIGQMAAGDVAGGAVTMWEGIALIFARAAIAKVERW